MAKKRTRGHPTPSSLARIYGLLGQGPVGSGP